MRIGSLPRALLLLAPLALAAVLLSLDRGGTPRSIVLVTLDTTRPDHLSCYGYPRPTSPAIDALAARGVALEGWAQAPETGPSLASTLTSRHAPVTGVRGNAERLDPRLPTLATIADEAGYRTGAFVSTVLLRKDVCAFERGFQTYDDEMTDPCFGHERAQRVAERTIDRALAWLDEPREQDDGRPFLLWVHLYDPHGPYSPPERTPRLDAVAPSLPTASPLPADRIPRYQKVGDSVDPLDYVDRYDHEIAYMDRHLGRLLERLDLDTTVVVVHADHGEALGEDDYWFRHGSLLHDAALAVPFVLAGYGVDGAWGSVAPHVQNLDIVPTVLDLAGLPELPAADGRSLAPWLAGDEASHGHANIAEARKREIVRDSTGIDTRWKLRYVDGGVDVTWWPKTDEAAGTERVAERSAAIQALQDWLRLGREPRPAPARRPDDVDDALRGLGYVADPEGGSGVSRPNDGR